MRVDHKRAKADLGRLFLAKFARRIAMKFSIDSERRWLYAIAGLAIIVLLALAYKFARPAVPRVLTMSTGGASGAYEAYAKRYAAALAEEGITLKLLPSKGAVENIERLRREGSGVDLAFVQNGLSDRDETANGALESLGSMFYEPVFLFYRSQPTLPALTRIAQLKGRRIAIGAQGSGTRVLAMSLLNLNGINAATATLVEQSADESALALREGSLDAVFIVANVTAPVVQSLFRDSAVSVASLELADTYSRHLGFINPIVIERGVIDVQNRVPPQVVRTIATTSSLVARDDLHPAIAYLLVRASERIHGGASLLASPGEFPSFAKQQDFPHSAEAERLRKEGVPFLYRHLPFNVANFISRSIVFLVPLFAIAISLSDWIPKIIGLRVKAKVYKHYKELKRIDLAVVEAQSLQGLNELAERLSDLDAIVGRLNIPNNYSNEQFGIRDHMDLVRVRIERKRGVLNLRAASVEVDVKRSTDG
jgi:TRAP transporter TAXI family solute receptor